MSEWEYTTLGDISVDISYGYTESASLKEVGPKFLRITDIQDDFVDWNQVPYCPISDKNHKKAAEPRILKSLCDFIFGGERDDPESVS